MTRMEQVNKAETARNIAMQYVILCARDAAALAKGKHTVKEIGDTLERLQRNIDRYDETDRQFMETLKGTLPLDGTPEPNA